MGREMSPAAKSPFPGTIPNTPNTPKSFLGRLEFTPETAPRSVFAARHASGATENASRGLRKTKVPEDGICKYGKRKYESATVENVSTAT